MHDWLINNLQYIVGSLLGFIVWLIRLEGTTKANRQRADMQIEALAQHIKSELAARDAMIAAVKEEAAHLARMGENIKDTLGPLLQKVAGMDAKVDILLERMQQK